MENISVKKRDMYHMHLSLLFLIDLYSIEIFETNRFDSNYLPYPIHHLYS